MGLLGNRHEEDFCSSMFSIDKLMEIDWTDHDPDPTFKGWDNMDDEQIDNYLQSLGLDPRDFE